MILAARQNDGRAGSYFEDSIPAGSEPCRPFLRDDVNVLRQEEWEVGQGKDREITIELPVDVDDPHSREEIPKQTPYRRVVDHLDRRGGDWEAGVDDGVRLHHHRKPRRSFYHAIDASTTTDDGGVGAKQQLLVREDTVVFEVTGHLTRASKVRHEHENHQKSEQ